MKNTGPRRTTIALAILLLFAGGSWAGQGSENSGAPKATAAPQAEFSSKDVEPTFRVRVNLVQVKVVVRDSKGEAVKGLRREDFQLHDQGKLQMISTFGEETQETLRERAVEASKTTTEEGATPGVKAEIPQRYVAMVFDDVHLRVGNVVVVRSAAEKLIGTMGSSDRTAVYSTSGQMTQEFTSDKEALKRTLHGLGPRPLMGQINATSSCPDVTYYMADLAINHNDQDVVNSVAQELMECRYGGNPNSPPSDRGGAAKLEALSLLRQQLNAGDSDNRLIYKQVQQVIGRLAGKPGERVMVLVSPGFLLSSLYSEEVGIIERANHAGVVINTIDARGLFNPVSEGNEISRPQSDRFTTVNYRANEQFDMSFVMEDFAEGTGGTFFHNSNDLAGGMQMAGAVPEVSYVLGFSPQSEKMDGKYHLIKVSVPGKKYEVQARRGYYAPKKLNNPEEEANLEIQEAAFSQNEIQDVGLDFHTQYFKTDEANAQLTVLSRIDVKGLRFRKADDRRVDNLTVATVIFDENGEYVTGGQKFLELRLTDPTYERMSRNGLLVKSSLAVKPGRYLVRQVVRESEGSQMAAKNGAVVIP